MTTKVSVVIPVHNGADHLCRCLHGLQQSTKRADEIVVVDDGSTDDTARIAEASGVRVLQLKDTPPGAAYARNRGAESTTGDIIFFLDADCVVHPDAIGFGVRTLEEDTSLAACFGSYDRTPADSGLVSQFKNLMHRFFHQDSAEEASTFWTGCGAVRRSDFAELGGFDEAQWSLEDIELGLRLKKAGKRIRLVKEMCVTHLKRWTVGGMLASDVFDRAVPWTALLVRFKGAGLGELNLAPAYRVSTIAANLAAIAIPAGMYWHGLWALLPVLLAAVLIPHRRTLDYFVAERGWRFLFVAVPLLTLYSFYCGPAFVVGIFCHLLRGIRLAESDRLFRKMTGPVVLAPGIGILLLAACWGMHMQSDEGIWHYIARVWVRWGIPPYVGAFENKTPGIFFLYALSYLTGRVSILMPRAAGIVAQMLTAVLLFNLTAKLHRRSSGVFALVLFGLTMAWDLLDGSFAHGFTESFMNLFSVLAMFMLVSAWEQQTRSVRVSCIVLAGVCMGTAIAFKQVAVFSAVAIVLLAYAGARRNNGRTLAFWITSALILVGILLATAASLLPLLSSGVTFADYIENAWLVLLQGGGGGQMNIVKRGMMFRVIWGSSRIVLFYPLLILYLVQRKKLLEKGVLFWWLIVWALLDFIAVNASGHYSGHQLRQVVPVFSIISGIGIGAFISDHMGSLPLERKLLILTLPVLLVVWLPYATLRKTKSRIQHPRRDIYREMGEWVRDHTDEEDYVQMLGPAANPILAYSERRSPSRFFSSSFVRRPGITDDILASWDKHPPVLVVRVDRHEIRTPIAKALAKNYEPLQPQPFRRAGITFLLRRQDL